MKNANRVEKKPLAVHRHFSSIAHKYHRVRTTDLEPIRFIEGRLRNLERIEAIDIGCGVGRYDILLYKHLAPRLRLTCSDNNVDMLNNLAKNLTNNGVKDYTITNANAEDIPFEDNIFDCTLTFNAVHHFDLRKFLNESARITKVGGYIFIYTRLRDQNSRNIWGRYFPLFNQKETRLYTLNRFVKTIGSIPNLYLQTIEYYKYGRKSNLERLTELARSCHYSTFALYSTQELEESINEFTTTVQNKFNATNNIHWFDENILFTIRKT